MGTIYYNNDVSINGTLYVSSFSPSSLYPSGGIYPTVNYTAFGQNASITSYATAIGYNARANNYNNTVAVGRDAYAYGQYSTAIGSYAQTNSSYSGETAIGYNTRATSAYTTALGYQAYAYGSYSTALGAYAQTNSSYLSSTAVGYNAQATGGEAIAIGRDAAASYVSSIVLGNYSSANSSYTVVLGYSASANGSGAISIGYGSISPIISYVSFDSSDTNRGVTFYDPSKIFFRNENISNSKTSTSSYTGGKTLQGYLDEKLQYNPTLTSSDAGKAIVVNSTGTGYELGNAGGTWGSISGSIANQTDLQTALDAKASASDVTSLVAKLPDLPSDSPDGTYVLRAIKANGTVTYMWGDENLILNTDF